MSSNSVVLNTNTQLTVNTDTSKIFIFQNRYESDNYINNSSYDPITLLAGTVMGRISSTGVVVPFTSSAGDGSQHVLGILATDLTLAAGASVQAPICVKGDVVKDKVVFVKPGDNMETVVGGRMMKDNIQGETVGVLLVPSIEMTDYDNS